MDRALRAVHAGRVVVRLRGRGGDHLRGDRRGAGGDDPARLGPHRRHQGGRGRRQRRPDARRHRRAADPAGQAGPPFAGLQRQRRDPARLQADLPGLPCGGDRSVRDGCQHLPGRSLRRVDRRRPAASLPPGPRLQGPAGHALPRGRTGRRRGGWDRGCAAYLRGGRRRRRGDPAQDQPAHQRGRHPAAGDRGLGRGEP